MTITLAVSHADRAHSPVGGSTAACEVRLTARKTPEMAPEELHNWLTYEPATGLLRWKKVNNWSLKVGEVVGSLNDQGYVKFKIEQVSYTASRAVWAMMYGVWPSVLIDHIDGDRANNRLGNLRLSTNQQNCQNKRKRRAGLKGATWSKAASAWAAQIRYQGRNKHLGLFATEQAAHDAYCEAAIRLYGAFARFE